MDYAMKAKDCLSESARERSTHDAVRGVAYAVLSLGEQLEKFANPVLELGELRVRGGYQEGVVDGFRAGAKEGGRHANNLAIALLKLKERIEEEDMPTGRSDALTDTLGIVQELLDIHEERASL